MATSSLTGDTLTISGENLTSTILGYLNGVTSDVQTQLTANATDISGKQASLTFGIGDTNVVKCGSGIADNDFLRINGTTLEGRSASQVLGDIGAQASLSTGDNVQIINNVISATDTNTTYDEATTSAAGLMSASDKNKISNYLGDDLTAPSVNAKQITHGSVGLVLNQFQHPEDSHVSGTPTFPCFIYFKDRGAVTTNVPHIYAYMYYDFAQDAQKYKFIFKGRLEADTGSVSDDRIKHNETTIDNALDIVMKLEAKRYLKTIKMYDASYTLIKDNSGNYTNLKDHDSVSEEFGFIAQDLLEIEELSFVVEGDSSGNETTPYSVSYNSIFVVGMQAIQELNVSLNTEKEKVIALESKIEAQETLINSLLERVTALENN